VSHVLGVDAGNTKTIALVARVDGAIVGAGRSGCGDIYGAASVTAALGAVEEAVTAAQSAAGVRSEDLLVGVFSLAGADWPEDFDLLRMAMEERRFGRTVLVVNDALGALRAGSPDGTGVVVACGTGVATAARAADGRDWHGGFWQEAGGALALGHRALRAVYRADLGIGPSTGLTGRVLDYFGKPSVEDVLHFCTARGTAWRPADAAPLASVLLDEASDGDLVARRIVEEQGIQLGDYALAAARRVGIEGTPFPLVLTGGVFRHPSPLLPDTIIARVRTTSPDAHPVRSRFEPAVGALFLALEAAGVRVDETLRSRLIPTLPPASFFDTVPSR
jgi:N-acetylglucosamine kinase-like BadF-type ATPase